MRSSLIRLNGLRFAAQRGRITRGNSSSHTPITAKRLGPMPSEGLNSTKETGTSVRRRRARSGRSNLPTGKPSRWKPSSGCTPTYQGQKPTTTTQTTPATAVTSPTSFGVASRLSHGQEINSENLANSKAKDDEAQVQARMDSLMMVITTLCDCIGAVDDSNAPNQYEVKMKIVNKISDLIDKIEY